MNARRILFVAALALALGGYIWLVERPRMAEETAGDLLVHFDVADVARLALSYPDAGDIVLERDPALDGGDGSPGGWRVVEPIATRADHPTVERLLTQIAEAKAERRIPADDAVDLATYGLAGDGLRARISIRLDDGTEIPEIVVGRTTPVGYLAFARVEGTDEVVVTPLLFHTGVKKTLLELRDKTLLSFPVAAAQRVRVTAGQNVLELVREGERWSITLPPRGRADADQVRSMLASLAGLQALDFYDDATRESAGIGVASHTVEVTLGDGRVTGLAIGGAAPGTPPGVYVERVPDGLLAKAPDWLPTRFAADPAPLRDRRLFDCGTDEVARIRFARADAAEFALVAGDGGWRLEPAADRAVRQPIAARRAAALTAIAGDSIVADGVDDAADLARYGLDDALVEIELFRPDGSSCGRARAARVEEAGAGGTRYYLLRVADGTVMSAEQHVFSRVDVLRDELLAAPVPAPAPQDPPE